MKIHCCIHCVFVFCADQKQITVVISWYNGKLFAIETNKSLRKKNIVFFIFLLWLLGPILLGSERQICLLTEGWDGLLIVWRKVRSETRGSCFRLDPAKLRAEGEGHQQCSGARLKRYEQNLVHVMWSDARSWAGTYWSVEFWILGIRYRYGISGR